MQTVSLTWEHSLELGGVLVAAGGAMALSRRRWVRYAGTFARETAVIAALYGLWQLAGTVSVTGTQDAFHRARWIRHFEHDIFLPSEATMQKLVLGHPLVVQFANLYYASMHFTMMLVFLLWLFIRHNDRYRPVRQVLGWTTLGCLLVQLMPVAPPRMLPGIVDTGMLYNQSVYDRGLPVDQLSAMPSVHVAWGMLVGYYTFRIAKSRWRWLGPIHATLTLFFVVVTGNHWWLDGIVATMILIACAWGVFGVRSAWHALRARFVIVSPRLERPEEPAVVGATS